MDSEQKKKDRSLKIVLITIICATIIALAGVGAWIYIQQQNLAQEERRLQQEKQLKEFEQSQINERERDRNCQVKQGDIYIPSYHCYEY